MRYFLLASILCGIAAETLADDPPLVPLRDGDRVVWLGGTFIERMQVDGYLETLLTCRLPDRQVTFRNLGWSGDTVFGDARGVFGGRREGYRRLIQDVNESQPTVIVVAYGSNESFAGKAGLDEFHRGLDRLLDDLAKTNARLVLVTPYQFVKVGGYFADAEEANRRILLYRDAILKTAQYRELAVIDLYGEPWFGLTPDGQVVGTDNGMHPNEYGYWHTSFLLSRYFLASPQPDPFQGNLSVTVDAAKEEVSVSGGKIDELEFSAETLRWRLHADSLPWPPLPAAARALQSRYGGGQRLRITGLADGTYQLLVDGNVLATRSAAAFRDFQLDQPGLPPTPDVARVNQLRNLIREKDELFFHRYRPQNETYLFLFRKHEQGNNAVEIPMFDPLIAEKEKQIAALAKPRPHISELRHASK